MPVVSDLIVRYGSDTSGAEAGTKKVQGMLGGVTKMALLAGGAMAVGFIGKTIMAGANFEQAMDGVSASLGGVDTAGGITTKQFAALSDEAIRIGATTSVGANEAALAMDLLAKSGISVEEIYNGVAQGVVNVSEATGESIDISASAFGTLTNMFKDTGISSSQMADTIVNAMKESDMSLSELQTGVARLAPVISATGMSFQESSGAIAYFNAQGFSAAEVGTSLTAVFTSLVAPTTEQALAMEAMGISAFDAKGEFVGFPDIMDQVAKATEGLTEQETSAAIAALFTADARDLMTIATKKGGGPLRDYIRLMEQSGTAATVSATRMDNLKGDFESLGGAIESVMLSVRGVFLPVLRAITQGLTGLIESFMAFLESIRLLMSLGLNPVEAALGAVQMALERIDGEDTPAVIDAIAGGFGELATFAGKLGEVLGDVLDAFQALAAGDISGFFEEIGIAANRAWNAITILLNSLAGAVIDLGAIALSAAIEFAGDLPGLAADAFGWIVDHLGVSSIIAAGLFFGLPGVFIAAAVHWRGDLADMVGRGFAWILEKLGFGPVQGDGTGGPEGSYTLPFKEIVASAVIGWAGDFQAMLGRGWAWIQEQLGFGAVQGDGTGGPEGSYTLPLGTVVTSAIIGWAGDLTAMVGNGWAWVRDKLGFGAVQGDGTGGPEGSYTIPLGDILIDGLGKLGTALQKIADDVRGWLKLKLGTAVDAAVDLGSFALDGAVKLGKILQGVADDLIGWLKPLLGRAADAAVDLGSFALDGAVKLGKILQGVADDLVAWVKPKLGAAADAVVPLGSFLLDGTVGLGRILQNVADDLIGWLQTKLGRAANATIPLGSFLVDGIVSLGGELLALLTQGVEWIKQRLPKFADATLAVGSFTVDGVVSAVEFGAKVVRETASQIFQAIINFDWVGTITNALTASFQLGNIIGDYIAQISWSDVVTAARFAGLAAAIMIGIGAAILAGIVLAPIIIGAALALLIGAALLGVVESVTGLDFSEIASAIWNGIKDAVDTAKTVGASDIKDAVVDGIDGIVAAAGDFATFAVLLAGVMWTSVEQKVTAAAAGAKTLIKEAITSAVNGIVSAAADFAGMAVSIGSALWEAIKAWVTENITPSTFGDLVKGAISGAGGKIDDAFSLAPPKGKAFDPSQTKGRSSLEDMLRERKRGAGLLDIDQSGMNIPIPDYSGVIAAANAARQAVVAAFTNMQIEVATAMRNTITSAVGAFTPIVQALTNVGNQARQAVGAALTNLQIEAATAMGNVVISASAAFLPIVQNLTNSANQTRQAVGAAFINMQIEVNATLTAFVASASAQALTAGAQFNTNLSQGISAAQANVQIKTADMITKLTTFASNARTQGLTAGQNFNQAITQGMNAAVANTQIAMDRVKSALNIGSQYSVGHGIGYSMGQGINAGISAWTSAIAATASAAVTNAVAAARNAAGARSPSKVMMQLGADMMAGATIGIERSSADFSSAVRRSANDATSAFNPSGRMDLNQSGRMAVSGRTAGGMGGGNTYIINVLKSEEMLALLRGAESGRIAQSQMSSRSREIGLGLRGI